MLLYIVFCGATYWCTSYSITVFWSSFDIIEPDVRVDPLTNVYSLIWKEQLQNFAADVSAIDSMSPDPPKKQNLMINQPRIYGMGTEKDSP